MTIAELVAGFLEDASQAKSKWQNTEIAVLADLLTKTNQGSFGYDCEFDNVKLTQK